MSNTMFRRKGLDRGRIKRDPFLVRILENNDHHPDTIMAVEYISIVEPGSGNPSYSPIYSPCNIPDDGTFSLRGKVLGSIYDGPTREDRELHRLTRDSVEILSLEKALIAAKHDMISLRVLSGRYDGFIGGLRKRFFPDKLQNLWYSND